MTATHKLLTVYFVPRSESEGVAHANEYTLNGLCCVRLMVPIPKCIEEGKKND